MTALDQPKPPPKDAQPFRPSKIALLAMVLAMQPWAWFVALPGALLFRQAWVSRRAGQHIDRAMFRLQSAPLFYCMIGCCTLAVILGAALMARGPRDIPRGRSRSLSLACAMIAIFFGIGLDLVFVVALVQLARYGP